MNNLSEELIEFLEYVEHSNDEVAEKVFKFLSKGESISNITKICKISEEKVRNIIE